MGDRTKEQAAFLRELRQSRAASFRGEIVPYFRYVFQSGFGLFVSACFFAALIWYTDLIKAVPEEWPVRSVGVAAISIAVVVAPLRTYLRAADTVFLLPMEEQLVSRYIGPAVKGAIVAGAGRSLVVLALYSPIYIGSSAIEGVANDRPSELATLTILIALIGGSNAYAGWRERQVAAAGWRTGLRAIRWALTVTAVAALLFKPFYWSIPFLILCAAIPRLLWRLPRRHALPWERLIQEEEATRRRWMGFLGWFVDVPTESAKAYQRKWVAWLGDKLDWRQSRAWHYLYAKTLLRSETFGAFFRWFVVMGAIVIVSDNEIADAVIYAVALLIGGMQLSELKRVRFVETADALPIAADGRLPAAAVIARVAGLTAAAVLAVVAAATAGGEFSGAADLCVLAAGLLWIGWLIPRRIAKPAEDAD
ncbi:ABC transporter permease [Cohnella panacarvi]|uniref:ABC transporter permease n=1 Tax=Cohnella panacarvi TaxID=400776 RepID=UPI00047E43BA|nr:ABC transporter permease [Cohnella panacarvi]